MISATPPNNKTKANKSTKGKGVKKSKMDEDDQDEDLTAEMDDPSPENTISEVKVTPVNVSRPDMQAQKGSGTYMDLDEADLEKEGEKNDNTEKLTDKEDMEDNVTEQTHHIIVPSYSSWFDYNAIHSIEKRAMIASTTKINNAYLDQAVREKSDAERPNTMCCDDKINFN